MRGKMHWWCIVCGIMNRTNMREAVLAMALGLFIVGVVGFSHISAVHNAAHDVRHANAFPCH